MEPTAAGTDTFTFTFDAGADSYRLCVQWEAGYGKDGYRWKALRQDDPQYGGPACVWLQ